MKRQSGVLDNGVSPVAHWPPMFRRVPVAVAMLALAIVPTVAHAQIEQAQIDQVTIDHTLGSTLSSAQRDWRGAIVDSLKLVSLEHAIRIGFQEKTRAELGGPFWADYAKSVRVPRQWTDTDAWGVNYIGHPIHGAASGLIWLDHSEKDKSASMFGRGYLASRGRAAAFAAIYSVQFEIGPLSEASIGNVGMRPETAGWVDYVVTPVGAFGFMIAEDALDRYFVRWVEGRVKNRLVRASLRLALGPSRFLANSAEGRLPWYRPDRPLRAD